MSLQQFGKGALRVAKNYTLRFSDTQTKVRDATSNAPWGPSGTQHNYIAQLTYNQNDFVEIMEMLDKRLNDKGKNWRHVYKSLSVVDYLLYAGSENVVLYFRDNLDLIEALKEFQYVDEDGKDCGAIVRQTAKDIFNLLSDPSRIREVRRNRASMRDRMIRGQQEDEEDESYATEPRRKRAMERDDDEVRPAIEASKQSLAEERQRGEQPSTPGGRDNKPSDSSPEPGKSGPLSSATHDEDRDDDLLEVEVPSSTPAAEFDFDEPPSPGSSIHREDKVPPPDASDAVARLSDAIPAVYPPLAHAEEHLDAVKSPEGMTKLKMWLQARIKKDNKDPTSHKPGRSPSQSPATVDDTNGGPSRMAAGQRVRRAVAKPIVKRDPKSPAKKAHPSRPKKDASRSGQGSANLKEAGPMEPANDASYPSAEGIHLTRESGKATLEANVRLSMKMTFPAWMCCGSSIGDGTH